MSTLCENAIDDDCNRAYSSPQSSDSSSPIANAASVTSDGAESLPKIRGRGRVTSRTPERTQGTEAEKKKRFMLFTKFKCVRFSIASYLSLSLSWIIIIIIIIIIDSFLIVSEYEEEDVMTDLRRESVPRKTDRTREVT